MPKEVLVFLINGPYRVKFFKGVSPEDGSLLIFLNRLGFNRHNCGKQANKDISIMILVLSILNFN